MTKASTTKPETKLKKRWEIQMKKVNLSTTIMSNVITALTVFVLAFIAGYFVSVSMHSNARAAVVSDIQVVKTVSKQ